MKNLGELIAEYRERAGYSVRELARMAHVDPHLIRCYEGGVCLPGIVRAIRLVRALRIPLTKLAAAAEESDHARRDVRGEK